MFVSNDKRFRTRRAAGALRAALSCALVALLTGHALAQESPDAREERAAPVAATTRPAPAKRSAPR
ncbi:MAG TPA: hypothetical protein VER32_16165, partial [Pyrinomonadaceae bacterium]|nr:hypothetical protein [Pyrinomonadaceae bacterium]